MVAVIDTCELCGQREEAMERCSDCGIKCCEMCLYDDLCQECDIENEEDDADE